MLSPQTTWQRAVYLKQTRELFSCNEEYGRYLKYAAVGRLPFLLSLPSSNVMAKLILCATYLSRDEYVSLGYGRAAELMSRVEELHGDIEWLAIKQQAMLGYLTFQQTRDAMSSLIRRTCDK